MRRLLFFTLASLLTVGLLLPFTSSSARAEDLSPDQMERVKQNCVSIKNSLNQLHASDALLRVNRGQVYEAMATKLMDTFNARLESNRLDSRAMTTVTGTYRSTLNDFRSTYIAYEQKVSEALRIDCNDQPNTFNTALLEARELRTQVHQEVIQLHRAIDDYRSAVGDFLLNYERVSE